MPQRHKADTRFTLGQDDHNDVGPLDEIKELSPAITPHETQHLPTMTQPGLWREWQQWIRDPNHKSILQKAMPIGPSTAFIPFYTGAKAATVAATNGNTLFSQLPLPEKIRMTRAMITPVWFFLASRTVGRTLFTGDILTLAERLAQEHSWSKTQRQIFTTTLLTANVLGADVVSTPLEIQAVRKGAGQDMPLAKVVRSTRMVDLAVHFAAKLPFVAGALWTKCLLNCTLPEKSDWWGDEGTLQRKLEVAATGGLAGSITNLIAQPTLVMANLFFKSPDTTLRETMAQVKIVGPYKAALPKFIMSIVGSAALLATIGLQEEVQTQHKQAKLFDEQDHQVKQFARNFNKQCETGKLTGVQFLEARLTLASFTTAQQVAVATWLQQEIEKHTNELMQEHGKQNPLKPEDINLDELMEGFTKQDRLKTEVSHKQASHALLETEKHARQAVN